VDAAYWQSRCLAAERALARARRGLTLTAQRKAVLDVLADLKAGAQADTHRIAGQLNCSTESAHATLVKMEGLGLVERDPGQRGIGGFPSGWRLGHLVQVTEQTE
jgi:DNA-binding MarR family transcriptional regulator